jgi:hypothetical protein
METTNATLSPFGDNTGELTFFILYNSSIVNAFFCGKIFVIEINIIAATSIFFT